ncbi:MAG: hypothetical protein HS104_09675 [Polyangiaceae bacterium]|nr:hypothetical protein [Polyangiaceae bacterium]MCL4754356.1 hypothetical protein [Myxococcales bacterium]
MSGAFGIDQRQAALRGVVAARRHIMLGAELAGVGCDGDAKGALMEALLELWKAETELEHEPRPTPPQPADVFTRSGSRKRRERS